MSSLLGMGIGLDVFLSEGMLERIMYIMGFFAVYLLAVGMFFLGPRGNQQYLPRDKNEKEGVQVKEEEEEKEKEKGKDDEVPAWVHPHAKPPSSFDDLLKCTPDALLRCRASHKCKHNRLSKMGSNGSKARVMCVDCGELLAEYTRTRPPKP